VAAGESIRHVPSAAPSTPMLILFRPSTALGLFIRRRLQFRPQSLTCRRVLAVLQVFWTDSAVICDSQFQRQTLTCRRILCCAANSVDVLCSSRKFLAFRDLHRIVGHDPFWGRKTLEWLTGSLFFIWADEGGSLPSANDISVIDAKCRTLSAFFFF